MTEERDPDLKTWCARAFDMWLACEFPGYPLGWDSLTREQREAFERVVNTATQAHQERVVESICKDLEERASEFRPLEHTLESDAIHWCAKRIKDEFSKCFE